MKRRLDANHWLLNMSDKTETRLRHKLEPGQCKYCDREREAKNDFHPSHDASPRCESGKRNHCSCDVCF